MGKHRCEAEVYGGRCTSYQCLRWASVKRDDKHYCNGHDPEAKAARRAKSNAKWDAEFAATKAKHEESMKRDHRRDQCEQALAGIENPEAFVAKVREAIRCDLLDEEGGTDPTFHASAVLKELSTMIPKEPPHAE